MPATAWAVSLGSALIATILAVAAYFIKKWIESVDETIKEHASDLKAISKQISTFQSKQDSQTENLAKAIQTQLSAFKFPHEQVDKIEQEVGSLKEVTQKKILPHLDLQGQQLGKVTVIENRQREQDALLIKLFEVVRRTLVQKPPDRK